MVTGTHEAWNIMAAVGWSFGKVFGVQGEDYTYFTQACPGPAGFSCERSPDIYINPLHDARKYIIAHETGHAMFESCNNNRDENLDASASNGATCGGGLRSKEFQSNGANEGAAWYYAAMAFNDRLDADCELGRSLDYDNNGSLTSAEESPSGEGDPATEPWANLDYLGNECLGVKTGRAVVLDYTRAFWDLTQDAPAGNGQGLFFGDVCDMWLEARPDTWDADGGGASGDDPETRLLDAATTLGISTEWNNVDNANGVHR